MFLKVNRTKTRTRSTWSLQSPLHYLKSKHQTNTTALFKKLSRYPLQNPKLAPKINKTVKNKTKKGII